MKLTGPEILKRIAAKEIVIDPFNPTHVNPNSVDLCLGPKLLVYTHRPRVRRDPTSDDLTEDWQNAVRLWDVDRICNRSLGHSNLHIEAAQWDRVLDMKDDNPTYELMIPPEGLVLVPGRLYLGSTAEYTETHTCVPIIDGRSSVGRLGIDIHSTAGFGDVGYCGTWTLEISVVEPVRVYAGVRFCQIHYDSPLGELRKYDSSKYQGERDPRPSRLWMDFNQSGKPDWTEPAPADWHPNDIARGGGPHVGA